MKRAKRHKIIRWIKIVAVIIAILTSFIAGYIIGLGDVPKITNDTLTMPTHESIEKGEWLS